MDDALLRHFQELNDNERRNLDLLEKGVLYAKNPVVANFKTHLKAGKQITIYKAPRFERCLEHTHNFVEMVYMCSGETTHLVNGAEVVLRAGELLLLNQHVRHENLPPGEDDIAVNFIILPPFFRITLAMVGDTESDLRKFLLGCLHNEDRAGGFLHFQVTDVPQVQHLVEILLLTFVGREPNRRSINQFTMGLLFLYLLNHLDKARAGSGQDALTLIILQYAEEHFKDGTLSDLAKRLGYNMNWLSRDIKRLTGSTFTELMQNKRISQAKFLLVTSAFSIAEIAKQVGYTNTSYFHRLFQQQAGCSPGEYRAMK